MKVAVIGSRNCGSLTVDDMIQYIPANCSQIISGGANGVDTLAKAAAEKLNIAYTEFLPDYKKYGRKAPIIRNEQIVKNAYYVLAFWDMESKGTASAIDLCIKNYIPFKIISIEDKIVSEQ